VVHLIYSDWIKRKQEEALKWQINDPGDNDDGGFQAEKENDVGGTWITAETLYILLKYKILEPSDNRIQRAKAWLLRHRNLGGDYGDGWPLINKGNSFIDTTSLTVMALSFFLEDEEVIDAITKAKNWILDNQNDDYGWGIWKYEDSLVSATSLTLLALKAIQNIFNDNRIESALQSGTAWLKLAQNKKSGLWGFTQDAKETNNASTCQAVTTLIELGEEPKKFQAAFKSFEVEFKNNGTWKTIQESYILKYFGEGLEQRTFWFNAPKVVSAMISYAKNKPHDLYIKQIIEATDSLKKFDNFNNTAQMTDVSMDQLNFRTWASVQELRALLDTQSYLQEHLEEYVSIMSNKLAVIQKAGTLKSSPIKFSLKKQSSMYVSGKFLIALFPIFGLSLLGIAYLTHVTSFEFALATSLFGMYILTFIVLFIGFKQKVVSKNRLCFLYFPIWALVVLATGLFIFERAAEGLIVLLLIGLPEVMHFIMSKSKSEHTEENS